MYAFNRFARRPAVLLLGFGLGIANATAQAQLDGPDTCAADSAAVACTIADAGTAADSGGSSAKSRGGVAASKFTRVCMSGDLAGSGSCPPNPTTVGVANSTDWACVKDNGTNLIWSLESRFLNWTYATAVYPNTVNATGRCGFRTGWRVPTGDELLGMLARVSATSRITGVGVFPPAFGQWYWTAASFGSGQSNAWYIDAVAGSAHVASAGSIYQVRLVHSGR
jgi:hypothetical protein